MIPQDNETILAHDAARKSRIEVFFFSNKCLKLLYIHVQQDTCLNCFLEKRIIFSIDPTIPNANNVERPYRDV